MKPRAKKKLGVISLVIVLLLVLIGRYPDPDTDAEYLVWKAGWTPNNYHVCLRYYEEDDDFRRSLVGKSREEIHRWFPVLVSPSVIKSHEGDAYRKNYIEIEHMSDDNDEWVGDSNLAIHFKSGCVVSIWYYWG